MNELEKVQEEKIESEPKALDSLVISPKEQEKKDFEALIKRTNEKRLELMKETPTIPFETGKLNKDWIVNNLNIWISLYINTLQTINIKNPILIRKNQETVIERDKIINDARENGEDTFEFEKSRAATLEFIERLKDQIEAESFKLEEFETTIKYLQELANI